MSTVGSGTTATGDWVARVPGTPAEGPLWDAARGVVWFVDIMERQLWRHAPADGSNEPIELPGPVGTVGHANDGGLVVALAGRVALLDPDAGVLRTGCALEPDVPTNRPNDGKPGPDGALWQGTMALDAHAGAGGLYRIDLRGPAPDVTQLIAGAGIPNGLDWPNPDRSDELLWVDSLAGGVDRLVLDADHRLVDRQRAVTVPASDGLPDGMTIDADGGLWLALHGGGRVDHLDPTGRRVGTFHTGVATTTSCAFGGDGLTDLYVTVAGSQGRPGGLMRFRDAGQGRPPFTLAVPPLSADADPAPDPTPNTEH